MPPLNVMVPLAAVLLVGVVEGAEQEAELAIPLIAGAMPHCRACAWQPSLTPTAHVAFGIRNLHTSVNLGAYCAWTSNSLRASKG